MIRSLPPLAAALACVPLLASAGAASAQSTGEPTRAPGSTASAAKTRTTAPAARTKARKGAGVRTLPHTGDAGTASTGSKGSDAITASGSAAPGGPGSPPPILPTPSPGSGATPSAAVTGPGPDLFEAAALLKT